MSFSKQEIVTGLTNFANNLIDEGCCVDIATVKSDELIVAINDESFDSVEETLQDLQDCIGLEQFNIFIS